MQLVNCDFNIDWNDRDYAAALLSGNQTWVFARLSQPWRVLLFLHRTQQWKSSEHSCCKTVGRSGRWENITDVITWFSDVIVTVTRPVLSCDFTDLDLTAVLFFSVQSSSPCNLPEVMWLVCLSVCLSVKYLYVHLLLSIKFLIQHSCWICIFILNVFLNSCLINFSFSCVWNFF